MVVVENAAQLSKFVGVSSSLKSVKAIVVYRGDVPDAIDCNFPVYTWEQFMEVKLYPLRKHRSAQQKCARFENGNIQWVRSSASGT